jgi:hypothetical protein
MCDRYWLLDKMWLLPILIVAAAAILFAAGKSLAYVWTATASRLFATGASLPREATDQPSTQRQPSTPVIL